MKKYFSLLLPIALLSLSACNDPQQGYAQQDGQQQGQPGQPGYAPPQEHMVRDGLIGGAIGYFLGRSHGGGGGMGYGYHPAYNRPIIVQHTYVTHNYVRPMYTRPVYAAPRSYSAYRPSYSGGGSSFSRSYRHH